MKALICGSFDPVTLGHVDQIRRASNMFNEVTVAIFKNSSKKYMFSEEQRLEMLKSAVAEFPNVQAELCSGLVAAYVRKNKIDVIVKGVRNQTDCAYEMDMARANKMIYDGCETLLLVSHGDVTGISSSLVRTLIANGESISKFVPQSVCQEIDKYYKKQKGV